MKTLITIVLILLITLGIYFVFFSEKRNETLVSNFEECAAAGYPIMESFPRQCRVGNRTFVEEVTTQYKDLIRINSPRQNETIESPVKVSGSARGNWYFEASFPVEILDEDGTSLGIAPIQAKGEWMTTEYVSFEGSVSFALPKGQRGSIIFRKDNPSGETRFDDFVSIPVLFK